MDAVLIPDSGHDFAFPSSSSSPFVSVCLGALLDLMLKFVAQIPLRAITDISDMGPSCMGMFMARPHVAEAILCIWDYYAVTHFLLFLLQSLAFPGIFCVLISRIHLIVLYVEAFAFVPLWPEPRRA